MTKSILTESVSVAIALGSNLGDSLDILENTLKTLNQTPGIVLKSQSSWYKTTAVGPTQPDYLNGCALLEVQLTPEALLQSLLNIERQFGRVRQERWTARTLDLDLLLYQDLVLDTPKLQVPHPRMQERAFVLVPLAEIAAAWLEPISQQSIAQLLEVVDCSGVSLFKD